MVDSFKDDVLLEVKKVSKDSIFEIKEYSENITDDYNVLNTKIKALFDDIESITDRVMRESESNLKKLSGYILKIGLPAKILLYAGSIISIYGYVLKPLFLLIC